MRNETEKQKGVGYEKVGKEFHISFEYEPTVSKALKEALPDAKFDNEQKVWITQEKAGKVGEVVSRLDKMVAGIENSRTTLDAQLAQLNPEAKIHAAFTKDDTRYTGKLVAESEHHMAQECAGRFIVHRKDSLRVAHNSKEPEIAIGQERSVWYQSGLAVVQDKREKAVDREQTAETKATRTYQRPKAPEASAGMSR